MSYVNSDWVDRQYEQELNDVCENSQEDYETTYNGPRRRYRQGTSRPKIQYKKDV